MTRDEAVWRDIQRVMARHAIDFESLLDSLARSVDRWATDQEPLVAGCLQSAAEHLRHAALDYYVSTK